MMRVKIITSLAGLDFSFQAGQIADIVDDLAKALIEVGYAEPLKLEVEAETEEPPENAALITAKTKARKRR